MASERAYHQAWHAAIAGRASWPPAQLAEAGGACAADLANVFVAGYQAAIRDTFPHTVFVGWAAFAVSEDRSEQDPLPGVTAAPDAHGYVLSGHKSWIAAVAHVEQLVVRAAGAAPGYYLVGNTSPGLALTRNPAPGMLATLSQGRAHFDHVRVPASHKLDDARVREFGAREACYIYTAFAAYAAARCREGADADGAALAEHLQQRARGIDPISGGQALVEFDRDVQRLRDRLAATLFQADESWQRDQQLIAMYSKGMR